MDSQPSMEILEDSTIYYTSQSNSTYDNTYIDNNSLSENYFISENGTVQQINANASTPEARTYYKHTKYSDDGCTTDKHGSEICIKCVL